jgi:hypothetical protein
VNPERRQPKERNVFMDFDIGCSPASFGTETIHRTLPGIID